MSLQATYSTTTLAFSLLTAPDSGSALPTTDPSALGTRPPAAFLQATVHDIRFTVDGSVPTSSHGMLLVAGAAPFFYAGPLNQLQFIQTASGSVLNVVYVADPSFYCALTPALLSQVMAQAGVTGTSLTLSGDLTAVNGVFSGNVSGVNGTFTGPVAGTTGTFSGKVLAPVVAINQNTAPADGTLVAGQCATWFDSTNGAAKWMFKAKQADGTIKTGSVNVQT